MTKLAKKASNESANPTAVARAAALEGCTTPTRPVADDRSSISAPPSAPEV
jgi:hypothetical protein